MENLENKNNEEESKKRKGFIGVRTLSKKRFVWPHHLHKSFIGSIFDIGLNNCSTKIIYDALVVTNPSVTMTAVSEFLQNIRAYRLRGRIRGPDNELDSSIHSNDPSQANKAMVTKLMSQNALLNESIDRQGHIIERLQWSLMKQSQLRDHTLHKLNKYQNSMSEKIFNNDSDCEDYQRMGNRQNFDMNNSHTSSSAVPVNSLSMNSSQSNLPRQQSEWDILFEMRSHMDIHRQLLNCRNETLFEDGVVSDTASGLQGNTSHGHTLGNSNHGMSYTNMNNSNNISYTGTTSNIVTSHHATEPFSTSHGNGTNNTNAIATANYGGVYNGGSSELHPAIQQFSDSYGKGNDSFFASTTMDNTSNMSSNININTTSRRSIPISISNDSNNNNNNSGSSSNDASGYQGNISGQYAGVGSNYNDGTAVAIAVGIEGGGEHSSLSMSNPSSSSSSTLHVRIPPHSHLASGGNDSFLNHHDHQSGVGTYHNHAVDNYNNNNNNNNHHNNNNGINTGPHSMSNTPRDFSTSAVTGGASTNNDSLSWDEGTLDDTLFDFLT